MKKLFIVSCLLIVSCTHSKQDEIVMDRNGTFYLLDGDSRSLPVEAYDLVEIDTTKFKVVGFK